MKMRMPIVALIVAAACGGCADRKNLSPMPSVDEETRARLEAPVRCGTAKQDIMVLEEERASVAKQMLAGARSVFPIAAAAGILMGDYRDRLSVATGRYNHDIEEKIEQIKNTCGIR